MHWRRIWPLLALAQSDMALVNFEAFRSRYGIEAGGPRCTITDRNQIQLSTVATDAFNVHDTDKTDSKGNVRQAGYLYFDWDEQTRTVRLIDATKYAMKDAKQNVIPGTEIYINSSGSLYANVGNWCDTVGYDNKASGTQGFDLQPINMSGTQNGQPVTVQCGWQFVLPKGKLAPRPKKERAPKADVSATPAPTPAPAGPIMATAPAPVAAPVAAPAPVVQEISLDPAPVPATAPQIEIAGLEIDIPANTPAPAPATTTKRRSTRNK